MGGTRIRIDVEKILAVNFLQLPEICPYLRLFGELRLQA